MKLSQRAQDISPFYVMELLEKSRALEAQGEDVVHMEVGEPTFPAPSCVKDEAVRAVKDNRTFYTHSLGIPELRAKLAQHYLNTEGVNIPPERIIITNGTSGAFLLLFGILLERGSLLAVADPGYPCYKNIALFMDAEILQIPVSEDSRFEITVENLQHTEKLPDVLVLANPSNPTGIIYREETLFSLYEYLSSRDRVFVVDEIYSGLFHNKKPRTALSISDNIIVINGFSKTYAMTGFRLGWMVIPENLIRPVQKCAQNLFISPPSLSQYSALSAFDNAGEIDAMRKAYKERRDFIVPRLRNIGFSIPIYPDGAFYVYAGIERWGIDSMDFVERALVEAGVALTPGYDFGVFGASTHIRFSYTNSMERLKIGCDRLEDWLKTL
ncbi:MAG: aminotransferase [Syntrophus sp. (in: bacteria)]|nr:aminotransferase [Syntrophus sp. (in: bacteria)]